MKLSLTIHGKVYSVESDEVHDGSDVHELAQQFKGLLVNAGYHPCNVDSIFNLDYQWFTEEEINDNMQGHLDYSNKIVDDWHRECGVGDDHKKKVEEWQKNLFKQDDQDDDYVF